ncbi:hypothetical protein ASE67_02615 [Sphingomonas sp. Leaf23]|uniref:phage head closure protein n=1 Tax=Sphingomonas sp. Leaf23 TaxID=1735689 RepID=UPI0006FAD9CA|nr:phage head closure protein [Sphingomonas sp. Leaf23]KQM88652.1 hypothetical protein ASE67_02615 [Sphingomonas sp. Leaf23]
MSAGPRDRRISIERRTVTSDDYGGEVETWTQIVQPWAKITYGTGQERRVAAQESATLTATFRIREDSIAATITPLDRILFDGATWDIASSVPYRREARDLTATRQA